MRLRFWCLAIAACCGLTSLAAGSDPAETAFRTVLTNAARHGVEATDAAYNVGMVTVDQVIFAQNRLLHVESGKIDLAGFTADAAKSNLTRITRLRERVNVSSNTTSSQVDFAYQMARAIAAQTDPQFAARWKTDIVELERLQGVWSEDRSKRLGNADPGDLTLHVVGGVSRFCWKPHSMLDGWVNLDPTKTPKQIDFFGINSDHNVYTIGIYELTGDALRLTYRHVDDRPASFSASGDKELAIYTLRRQPEKQGAGIFSPPCE